MKVLIIAVTCATALILAMPAAAQTNMGTSGGPAAGGQMSGMAMDGMQMARGASPASDELMKAMHHMDENMMAVDDPDPSKAWAKKMIAHHEGAIAMSEIELQHGRDPEAHRLARKTIAEQRQSIAELKSWLARH